MRLTGKVLKVEARSGVKDGNPWSMTMVRVLELDNVQEATIGRDYQGQPPRAGDDVDYVVEVSARSGARGGAMLNATITADYPAARPAAAAPAERAGSPLRTAAPSAA